MELAILLSVTHSEEKVKGKGVLLHAMKAPGVREGTAPTHS
jgi:hypothetical protein